LNTARRLVEFFNALSYAVPGLVQHLHTRMLQFLSLSEFINEHRARRGFRNRRVLPPRTEMRTFSAGQKFLQKALDFELPLKAAVFIVRALLRESQEPEEQLRSALAYAIASSEIRCLFSFSRDLEVFL
jgi:hypothetical protein